MQGGQRRGDFTPSSAGPFTAPLSRVLTSANECLLPELGKEPLPKEMLSEACQRRRRKLINEGKKCVSDPDDRLPIPGGGNSLEINSCAFIISLLIKAKL